MWDRYIEQDIAKNIADGNKIILVYGPRQAGKTTLIEHILAKTTYKALNINADKGIYNEILSSRDSRQLLQLCEGYDLLFVDEAQRIPELGINIKILHEERPELRIILTGSSSLELAGKVKEPLTGRTWTYTLLPIALAELNKTLTPHEINLNLESYLRFGLYPELLSYPAAAEKNQYLLELSSSYLYKDILELAGIKHSSKLKNILRLLALQIGSEVSINEIANSTGLSKNTVDSYIDLLEQSFVVFRVQGFSRNLRKEVTKMPKIYFYDLGIRNILIENTNTLDKRNDVGALWENFLMLERKKLFLYSRIPETQYFWRTSTGAELDCVESRGGNIYGYEYKWQKKTAKPPKAWQEIYQAPYACINQNNYLEYLTKI